MQSPNRHAGRQAATSLQDELRRAEQDLAHWQDLDRRHGATEIAGLPVRDPRIQWNLGFHGRRIAALTRALRNLGTTETRT